MSISDEYKTTVELKFKTVIDAVRFIKNEKVKSTGRIADVILLSEHMSHRLSFELRNWMKYYSEEDNEGAEMLFGIPIAVVPGASEDFIELAFWKKR